MCGRKRGKKERWRERRLRREDEATRVKREGKGNRGVAEVGERDWVGKGVVGAGIDGEMIMRVVDR